MIEYTSEIVKAADAVVRIAEEYERFLDHITRVITLESSTPHEKLSRILSETNQKLGR